MLLLPTVGSIFSSHFGVFLQYFMEWRRFPVDADRVGVFSERKSAAWVLGFEECRLHAFIGGFHFISYVVWIGRKNLFYQACVLVLSRGLSTNS